MVRVTGGRRRPARFGRSGSGEDGLALVLCALVLIALLAMSALVVDIGNASQIRRQAQNTADAAALAGAQDLPDGAAAVASVKDYAAENLDIPTSAWGGCQDPDALAVVLDTPNNNQCISTTNAYSRLRVQLPNQEVDTYFGPVLGRDAINTSAAAVAGAVLTDDDRIIPAAVTVSDGTGHLCVENSGNNQDCASRNSGNFGSIAAPRLNFYLTASHQDRLRINWSMSLDHDIDFYNGYPAVCDGAIATPCNLSNLNTPNTANHVRVETGNNVPDVTDGLITGFTATTTDEGNQAFCGRLARPQTTSDNIAQGIPDEGCSPASPTLNVLNTTINGRHLYAYLTDEAKFLFYPEIYIAGEIGFTSSDTGWALTNSWYHAGDARLECFLDGYRYDQATGIETLPDCSQHAWYPGDWDDLLQGPGDTAVWPIIDKEITADPRFGVIPVLGYWPNGNSQAAPIAGFWGLFLYDHHTTSTSLQAMDGWVYDPALIETPSGQPGIQFGFQVDPIIKLVE